jgi:hypothetical protein
MTIKLGCPHCGEVDLTLGDIALQRDGQGEPFTYRFQCPGCRQHVVKRADVRMLRLLKGHGMRTPATDGRPPVPAAAPPITYDDVLDFHVELQSDEAIAEALASWSHAG